MNAKELRIGNLVYHNDEIIEIKSLHSQDDDVNDEISFHAINGIKLTEDWLIKCGFVKEFWKNKTQTYYLFNGIIVILKDDYYENGAIFYKNTLLFEEKLNLHKLQNLYFVLKGDELIVSDAVS